MAAPVSDLAASPNHLGIPSEQSVHSHHDEADMSTMSRASDSERPGDEASRAASNATETKGQNRVSDVEGERQDSARTDDSDRLRPWETRLLRVGPIAGICALLLAILGLMVALAILISSRDEPKKSWSVPPSSWLAVTTAVSNQALRFAALEGVAIAWWFKALRGSTFAKLHSDWHSGTHLIGALTAGRHMGWIGLACIFSTLVAFDGPFMQRATSIVTSPAANKALQLSVTITPEIPNQYISGYGVTNGTSLRAAKMFNATVPSSQGSVSNNVHAYVGEWFITHIARPYWEEATLPEFIHGCAKAHCKAKVKGPALAVKSCTSRETFVSKKTFVEISGSPESVVRAEYAPPIETIPFIIQPMLVLEDRESIELVTAYSEMPQCSGVINMTSCTLVSRKLDPRWNYYDSTLAGIVQAVTEKWAAYAATASEDGQLVIEPSNAQVVEEFLKNVEGDFCWSFQDPWSKVMQSMNEMMFYEGVLLPKLRPALLQPAEYEKLLDPGLRVNESIFGYLDGPQEVYRTDLLYFLAAAVIEGISIALILPTYVGFWKLGRHVTFSPLEVAKAFEAPILTNCNSNLSGREIAKAYSDKKIQYGVSQAHSAGGGVRLAFADPSIVEQPEKGVQLD